MSAVKLAVVCGLAAMTLSACGSTGNPEAGSPNITPKHAGRAKVDDPRKRHLSCLLKHHFPAVDVPGAVKPSIQIGTPGVGPLIVFQPTPGAAQNAQISAQAQSAEVIGSALLYPRGYTDNQLKTIEACVALGVSG